MAKRRRPTDVEALQLAMRQLDSAEKHMQPIMERTRRARLVFHGRTNPSFGKPRRENDPTDWHSRHFPAIANEQAELLFAEMSVDDPRFSYTARKHEFASNARLAEQAVDYYQDRDHFARTFRLALRAAIRDGGAVVRTTWGRDEYGEWGTRNLLCRLEDIFPDPTAADFAQCAWVIHRTKATMDDLHAVTDREGKCIYSNLDRLNEGGGGREGNEHKRESETQEAFDAATTGVHTIHTKWTPYGRLVVADRQVVILRQDESPFEKGRIPFTMIRLIDDEDCIVGTSPMTLIDDMQEAYWSALNSLIDAISLAVNPPRLADIEEDANAANYPIYPGCTIPARNGGETVKVLQDLAGLDKYNVAQLLETLRSIMERLTGMNSAIAGLSQADTATEAAINVRQGKGRVAAEMNVADEGWSQVAKLTYWRIQQFCSEEVEAQLSGGSMVRFAPENLADMMITPKSAASERSLADLERQDALAALGALQALIADPAQLPSVDLAQVVVRVCEAFRLPPDIVGPSLAQQQAAQPRGVLLNRGMAPPPVAAPVTPPPDPLAANTPAQYAPRPEQFVAQ